MNSYRAINNMKKGMEASENKNVKVTLELLQSMDYEDIAEKDKDDFQPQLVLNDEDINSQSEEDESVFNYLFPKGLKKKLHHEESASITNNKYADKVYKMKKKQKKNAVKADHTLGKSSKQPGQPS